MNLGLRTRLVVETGGSGTGPAVVRQFLKEGSKVAFFARHADRVATVAKEVGSKPVLGGVADVRAADAINGFASDAHTRIGRVDVLVANAGDRA